MKDASGLKASEKSRKLNPKENLPSSAIFTLEKRNEEASSSTHRQLYWIEPSIKAYLWEREINKYPSSEGEILQ
jgi:hypothetical protein